MPAENNLVHRSGPPVFQPTERTAARVSSSVRPFLRHAFELSCSLARILANDCAARTCACRLMARASSGLVDLFIACLSSAVPIDCCCRAPEGAFNTSTRAAATGLALARPGCFRPNKSTACATPNRREFRASTTRFPLRDVGTLLMDTELALLPPKGVGARLKRSARRSLVPPRSALRAAQSTPSSCSSAVLRCSPPA